MLEKLRTTDAMKKMCVFWINSNSVRVTDAKLLVYKKFEKLITTRNIRMHHAFDDFEEFRKICVVQELKNLKRTIKKCDVLIKTFSLDDFLQKVESETLTRKKIGEICFQSATFFESKTFSMDTVLKDMLQSISSQLCVECVEHLHSVFEFQSVEQHLFGRISNSIAPLIQPLFVNMINLATVPPLKGSITEKWIIEVTDQVLSSVCKKRSLILGEIKVHIKGMFELAASEFRRISMNINAYRTSIVLPDQAKCK